MELWELLLYAVASLLALRSLIVLMIHHKHAYMAEFFAEEVERRKKKASEQEQASDDVSPVADSGEGAKSPEPTGRRTTERAAPRSRRAAG